MSYSAAWKGRSTMKKAQLLKLATLVLIVTATGQLLVAGGAQAKGNSTSRAINSLTLHAIKTATHHSGGKISAHLTKTSFTSSQAAKVKLIYKFSVPSK